MGNVKELTPIQIGILIGDRYIQGGYKENWGKEGYPRWFYPTGVTLWSLCLLTDRTKEKKYLDFARDCFRYYVVNDRVEIDTGQADPMDLAGAMGHAAVEVYNRTREQNVLNLSKRIAEFIMNKQPRLLDGTFCYFKHPELRRIWIDSLFMVCPLLVKIGKITGEERYYDEVIKQLFAFTVRLQDPLKKLFYQRWGWEIYKTTHSPGFWGRGNGWVLMAMTEVLDTLPEGYKARQTLSDVYKVFIHEIIRHQDKTGMWHQLVDLPDSFEETSATAMFTYCIAKAVKKGWINEKYDKQAKRGIEGLKTMIDNNGDIRGISFPKNQYTLQDYYRGDIILNDWHGIGPVILAACAVDELIRQ